MNKLQELHCKVERKLKIRANQREMAEMIGVTYPYYRKVWCGEKPMTKGIERKMRIVLDGAQIVL